ncbi:ubiquitin-like protein Pup [Streptomyces sp900105755]|uniref:ubiquitin-like protein Pup n=1 Tax=Streptomyces sp. 900105755 TaxID=3154389 RepID=UPI0033343860
MHTAVFNCDEVPRRVGFHSARGTSCVVQRREERRRQEDSREEDAPAEVGDQPATRDSKISSDTDDLLDEIDDLLKRDGLDEEVNAERFVSGFVQKGGQ